MSLESFFKNKDALLLVDGLAKRYGLTPIEVVSCQTIYEFNFNVAVMLATMDIEAEIQQEAMASYKEGSGKNGKEEPTLKEFGIKRVVRTKK